MLSLKTYSLSSLQVVIENKNMVFNWLTYIKKRFTEILLLVCCLDMQLCEAQ